MIDVIDESIRVFAKYNSPDPSVQYKQYEFWRSCLAAGLLEIEVAYQTGDMEHVTKELADLFSIVIDSMYKVTALNTSPEQVKERILQRLERNDKKNLTARNKEFYDKKSHGLSTYLQLLAKKTILEEKDTQEEQKRFAPQGDAVHVVTREEAMLI